MFLGLEGIGVFLAYAGSVLVTLFCIVYGIVFWNKPADSEINEIEEETRWEQHDPELSESRINR